MHPAHDTSGQPHPHFKPAAERPASGPPEASPARGTMPGQVGYGSVVDRRSGVDRRAMRDALEGRREGSEGSHTGLERRRGAGRRLSDALRSAEEGAFTTEQFLFVKAIDAFKQSNAVAFPTWTDVLEVIRLLGYRKTMGSELNLPACEDWREPGDGPSNVRPRGFERRLDGTVGQRERRKFAA